MTILSARLLAAAEFVRQDAHFADVGTDHALLPIFLLEQKKIQHAYVTDIKEGPLSIAKKNVEEKGFLNQVSFFLTDGLNGLSSLPLTDIAICGMGGEMIVHILEEAQNIKRSGVRLILQPMTRPGILRKYLSQNGFAIQKESLCYLNRHFYACICCEYTGIPYGLSPMEAEIGQYEISHSDEIPIFQKYLEYQKNRYQKRVNGQKAGNTENELDTQILKELEAYYEHT